MSAVPALLMEPKKTRHTKLTGEAMEWARKLKEHMRHGRRGRIDYSLQINSLIRLYRRKKKDLTYVERYPSTKVRRKWPDVYYVIWTENEVWWERQRTLISHNEGGRMVPNNQILTSLFIQGVPLLLAEEAA